MSSHIALLGDSVFDNAAYTGDEPDVLGHLKAILPVVDLRAVCDQPRDYANPIEPSGRGGYKIARAVARACGALAGAASVSRVFVS